MEQETKEIGTILPGNNMKISNLGNTNIDSNVKNANNLLQFLQNLKFIIHVCFPNCTLMVFFVAGQDLKISANIMKPLCVLFSPK
jgi:hypothetical protein